MDVNIGCSEDVIKICQKLSFRLFRGHLFSVDKGVQKMSCGCIFAQWEVLFHGVRHVAQPFFHSSPERTNQTLALERALHVFMWQPP